VDEYRDFILENFALSRGPKNEHPTSRIPSIGSGIKAGRRLNLSNIFGFFHH
jgi:hypothetical protein